jgi:hypothetical protein
MHELKQKSPERYHLLFETIPENCPRFHYTCLLWAKTTLIFTYIRFSNVASFIYLLGGLHEVKEITLYEKVMSARLCLCNLASSSKHFED